MAAGRVEELAARPAPRLAHLVSGYQGSRHEGFQPGTHLGLPSPELEVIICWSVGTPLPELVRDADGRWRPARAPGG